MSNYPQTYDDEIDLLSLIQTVWDGKWKIALIMSVSLLSVFGFIIVKPNTTFIASTEIKPITSFELDKYKLFNSSLKIIEAEQKAENEESKVEKTVNIFEITQPFLLSLYVEQTQEGSLLETGIDKYNLINKDDFDSERDYKDAIQKFASEIEVLKPTIEKKEIRLHYVLRAEYNDKSKWKQLLAFVNYEANKKVKATIINRFSTIVSVENQKKKFAIKDIEIKIDNVKKDYDRYTKNKLAFLTEQAAIARKLDIQKNTIASQRFSAQNTFVTNVKTDAPFYLRGYLAIEEEINQITARKDKSAFTKDLFKLEKQKRELEQDKTIQRAINLFNKTPLNTNHFKSTLVKTATTDFEINSKKNLYYALSIILGGMIGVVFVLLSKAFQNRGNNSVS